MENYKATMIDCNVTAVAWLNLLGLQKEKFIFRLNYLIHLPQQNLAGQYFRSLFMEKISC